MHRIRNYDIYHIYIAFVEKKVYHINVLCQNMNNMEILYD